MSHFLLAVFTDSRPIETTLDRIMLPYEETQHSDQPKWDWWQIGGRWLGELLVKPGVNDFILGDAGVFDNEAPLGGVDGAKIGNLDLEAMLDRDRESRARHWDDAQKEQQNGVKPHPWTVDTSEIPRSEYIGLATPFTPFAYVLDGQWSEKGEMGWFGIATNEKPQQDWNAHFAEILKQQPEDHWITVIDCHI